MNLAALLCLLAASGANLRHAAATPSAGPGLGAPYFSSTGRLFRRDDDPAAALGKKLTDEFPQGVLMVDGQPSICDLIVISNTAAVGAATCFEKNSAGQVDVNRYTAMIGGQRGVPLSVGPATNVVIHPRFNADTFSNNIAVIQFHPVDISGTPKFNIASDPGKWTNNVLILHAMQQGKPWDAYGFSTLRLAGADVCEKGSELYKGNRADFICTMQTWRLDTSGCRWPSNLVFGAAGDATGQIALYSHSAIDSEKGYCVGGDYLNYYLNVANYIPWINSVCDPKVTVATPAGGSGPSYEPSYRMVEPPGNSTIRILSLRGTGQLVEAARVVPGVSSTGGNNPGKPPVPVVPGVPLDAVPTVETVTSTTVVTTTAKTDTTTSTTTFSTVTTRVDTTAVTATEQDTVTVTTTSSTTTTTTDTATTVQPTTQTVTSTETSYSVLTSTVTATSAESVEAPVCPPITPCLSAESLAAASTTTTTRTLTTTMTTTTFGPGITSISTTTTTVKASTATVTVTDGPSQSTTTVVESVTEPESAELTSTTTTTVEHTVTGPVGPSKPEKKPPSPLVILLVIVGVLLVLLLFLIAWLWYRKRKADSVERTQQYDMYNSQYPQDYPSEYVDATLQEKGAGQYLQTSYNQPEMPGTRSRYNSRGDYIGYS
ncbi:hypothetical protein H4R18_001630 [Coemansia javaensis]|uniref:Peptidase S1 domain-containing protein n=1 Tax=Coemansia javaensis TaxID=2761396 RepID=A0A9W8HEL9_9FUNG|nr:hypothetical protein H4R18_001630 [Coemansia javaensis]